MSTVFISFASLTFPSPPSLPLPILRPSLLLPFTVQSPRPCPGIGGIFPPFPPSRHSSFISKRRRPTRTHNPSFSLPSTNGGKEKKSRQNNVQKVSSGSVTKFWGRGGREGGPKGHIFAKIQPDTGQKIGRSARRQSPFLLMPILGPSEDRERKRRDEKCIQKSRRPSGLGRRKVVGGGLLS